ncbi:MAG: carbohydrate kinase [Citrobacter freundii]|nr:MAG: carbohydrate kinase [Citrobacter freundii]
MNSVPVIAIIDAGKTNKKLFLFDEDYNIVHESSACFTETVDEDGDPCEDLESLRLFVVDSLRFVSLQNRFDVKAINFSAYGASFVYIDKDGSPLTPLYNYLKPYPPKLKDSFYSRYGGEEHFSVETASPVLGSLNAGMQVYRLKHEQPGVFKRVKHALHLPQYLSYLVSGRPCSDITSIGCHTNLWDFKRAAYHDWVKLEGIERVLAPIAAYNETAPSVFPSDASKVGIGLHDSSAALIPYLLNFTEPFALISSGTWCISLNPFNHTPVTVDELKQDCLCYNDFKGNPVKASRLFAGHIHDEQVKRIANHFQQDPVRYRSLPFEAELIEHLHTTHPQNISFETRELSAFSAASEAYHQLIMDLVNQQYHSTQLVLRGAPVKRIFVDGGFGKNDIYMNLLAAAFTGIEVYAAAIAQATSLGAALAIHPAWNKKQIPGNIIELMYYAPKLI